MIEEVQCDSPSGPQPPAAGPWVEGDTPDEDEVWLMKPPRTLFIVHTSTGYEIGQWADGRWFGVHGRVTHYAKINGVKK